MDGTPVRVADGQSAAPDAVRVFLARHGETVFNVEGRWQGQNDSPLTERGVQQSELLGQALAAEPLAAVYASPLGRAYQTALRVAEPHGLPVITDDRLLEIHTGRWTGRLAVELRTEYPELMQAWASHPASVHIPDGESVEQVRQRLLAFFAQVMPRHPGRSVAVITHGTSSQCVLVSALGGTADGLWVQARTDNCQISTLDWTLEDGLRVVSIGDVSHLAPVGSLRGWRVAEAVEGEGR